MRKNWITKNAKNLLDKLKPTANKEAWEMLVQSLENWKTMEGILQLEGRIKDGKIHPAVWAQRECFNTYYRLWKELKDTLPEEKKDSFEEFINGVV